MHRNSSESVVFAPSRNASISTNSSAQRHRSMMATWKSGDAYSCRCAKSIALPSARSSEIARSSAWFCRLTLRASGRTYRGRTGSSNPARPVKTRAPWPALEVGDADRSLRIGILSVGILDAAELLYAVALERHLSGHCIAGLHARCNGPVRTGAVGHLGGEVRYLASDRRDGRDADAGDRWGRGWRRRYHDKRASQVARRQRRRGIGAIQRCTSWHSLSRLHMVERPPIHRDDTSTLRNPVPDANADELVWRRGSRYLRLDVVRTRGEYNYRLERVDLIDRAQVAIKRVYHYVVAHIRCQRVHVVD